MFNKDNFSNSRKKKESLGNSPINAGSSGTNYANEGDSYNRYIRPDYKKSYIPQSHKKKNYPPLTREEPVKNFLKRIFILATSGAVFGCSAAIVFNTLTSHKEIIKPTIQNNESINSTQELDSILHINTQYESNSRAYSVAEVVEGSMPCVVSITNINENNSEKQITNNGSGIIVGNNADELLIATNYHVIASSGIIEVTFMDGTTVTAQKKGTDTDMDLAVIAVPLLSLEDNVIDSLAVAKLGDSETLTVGEPVIAIGNALGYGQSVTTGVVSALNRKATVSTDDTEVSINSTFIQTDAAINPGNSGGALLNTAGEVIGINTSKVKGEKVEGMGYAIPISAAEPIISELMLKESRVWIAKQDRGFLGISGKDIPQDAVKSGMPEGVYVSATVENGAADCAGISNGDVIKEIDGTKVRNMDDVQQIMQYYSAGEKITIILEKISKSGYKEEVVDVILGKQ